jgi:hypothetical protein
MAYKKNFHEVEISREELFNLIKDFTIDEHRVDLDGAPAPKSHNQMTIEMRGLKEELVEVRWVRIRWQI